MSTLMGVWGSGSDPGPVGEWDHEFGLRGRKRRKGDCVRVIGWVVVRVPKSTLSESLLDEESGRVGGETGSTVEDGPRRGPGRKVQVRRGGR